MHTYLYPLALMVLLSSFSIAHARVGDWGNPIEINEFPYVHHSSTQSRASVIDRYSCASQLSESGPEVLYRLQVSQNGILTVQLQGDSGQVDIDIHLLSAMSQSNGQATACLARHNQSLEQSVSPGVYYLAVDSYAGVAQAGEYTLNVQFTANGAWNIRPIAQGVTLETKRYDALFGGSQYGSVIRVDLNQPNVEVKPVKSSGCQTTSQLASSVGAVAAINGGFFGGGCGSVSLLKIDGQLFHTNARSRSAIGFNQAGVPSIDWIQAGQDWPSMYHALGGLAKLVSLANIDVQWERDSADYGFTHYRNPRTGVGIINQQELLMATMDGRTSAGLGVSLFDFAQWFVWLGANEALNLDGGGSTTLWTRTEGVVNYPSDNGLADHNGERGVASILAVFAPPLQREAEWVISEGPTQININESASFEIWARDPDAEWLTIQASHNGQGQLNLNTRADGSAQLSYTATRQDPSQITITLEARTQQNQLDGTQQIDIEIIGSQGTNNEGTAGEMMTGGSMMGGSMAGEMSAGINSPDENNGGADPQPQAGEISGGQTSGGQTSGGMDNEPNMAGDTQESLAGHSQNESAGIESEMMSGGNSAVAGQGSSAESNQPSAQMNAGATTNGLNNTWSEANQSADSGPSCDQKQRALSSNVLFLVLLLVWLYKKVLFNRRRYTFY